jgi:hypothetical protein
MGVSPWMDGGAAEGGCGTRPLWRVPVCVSTGGGGPGSSGSAKPQSSNVASENVAPDNRDRADPGGSGNGIGPAVPNLPEVPGLLRTNKHVPTAGHVSPAATDRCRRMRPI